MAVRSSSASAGLWRAGIAGCVALALSACSGSWWPLGSKSSGAPDRIPAGATEFTCAGGKRLLVRFPQDAKSAWVIYPDREFRLDRTASDAGERYSNGVSALVVQGTEVHLDEGSVRAFSECKRKVAG